MKTPATHWVAEIFPLNPDDVERLAEDIRANGQRNPILTWKGEILDGRTRWLACQKAGVEPHTEEFLPKNGEATDDELLAVSWSLNEARRHLSTSQRACAAAEVAERLPERRGRPKKGENKPKIRLISITSTFHVGEDFIRYARQLLREAPHIFAAVKKGDLTVMAGHEAFESAKKVEATEMQKMALADMRQRDAGIAEDVETGKVSMDEARERLNAIEERQQKRKSEISKVATGIFMALAGLAAAREALHSLDGSSTELIQSRQPYQRKDDKRRYAEALEFIEQLRKDNDNE
jgi:ParB-like chromosome segregation protein Spo0J